MTANQRKPCSNYTLPSLSKLNDIPECSDAELASYKFNALISLHSSEELCKEDIEKLGIIKEYSIQEHRAFHYSKNFIGFRTLMYGQDSPDHGLRISKLYKEVSKDVTKLKMDLNYPIL